MSAVGGQLRILARRVLPTSIRRVWGSIDGPAKVRRARRAFDAARPGDGAFLPPTELRALMQRGYAPPDRVRYDPEGLVVRANDKILRLQRVVDLGSVRTALELGCWDGMVGAALAGRGVHVCGLDISMTGVDARATRAGVRFLQSDAGAIALADASIDLVYSFASLEHFPAPDRCLQEVARVLKPGGHVFFNFGPLNFSPYGRHAYRQIPVPFCHLLFSESDLQAWAANAGLPHDWPYVNGWALKQYRELFASVASRFDTLSYIEYATGGVGVELVAEHPTHFRHYVDDFEEFLIAIIDIALRKH